MTLPEDDEGLGGVAEDEFGSTPHFDPLLSPWDDTPAPPAPFALDESSGLDGIGGVRASAQRESGVDDALWWEAPPASPYLPREGPAWFPDRTQPPYSERLTELQQRLRQETITLPRHERRWLVTVREVAETLLLALLIFLAVRGSFQNFKVEGHSMDPSLADGEYLIVNKLTYAEIDLSVFDFLPFFEAGDSPVHSLWGTPGRGDVIVFRAPTSPERDFIKRIIGLPGDTVVIEEGSGNVTVNGSLLTEGYIQGTTGCSQQTCTWNIPKADTPESQQTCGSDSCYFVLGDNRQNSSDSRQGWLVPKENIIGKALLTYWDQGSPDIHFAPNHSVGITDEASAEQ